MVGQPFPGSYDEDVLKLANKLNVKEAEGLLVVLAQEKEINDEDRKKKAHAIKKLLQGKVKDEDGWQTISGPLLQATKKAMRTVTKAKASSS